MNGQRFNVIYADFPWAYQDKNTGGSLKSGAAYKYGSGNKYSTMSVDELRLLTFDINKAAARDSVIAMWATVPLQDDAMSVYYALKELGWIYVTKFFWIKDRKKLGMGRNFRGEIEELWFLRRGNVKPFGLHIRNYLMLPPLQHSRKPQEFRWIVELVGWVSFKTRANFLELFATEVTPGWACAGWEVDGMDIKYSLFELSQGETHPFISTAPI